MPKIHKTIAAEMNVFTYPPSQNPAAKESPLASLFQWFSMAWKNSFHGVEKYAPFFHGVENVFPRRGKPRRRLPYSDSVSRAKSPNPSCGCITIDGLRGSGS